MTNTFNDHMQQDNLRMYAAINRVRKLHALEEFPDASAGAVDLICAECREMYPCETVQALEPQKSDLTEFPKFDWQLGETDD